MKRYIIIGLLGIFGVALLFGIRSLVKKKEFNSLMQRIEEEVVLSQSVLNGEEVYGIYNLKPIQMFVSIPEINKHILLFREFERNDEKLFLGADLDSLETTILRQEDISYFEDYAEEAKASKLYRLIHSKKPVKNFSGNGYTLMIEVSEKVNKKYKFERDLFLFLSAQKEPSHINVVVSNRWILEDKVGFKMIDSLIESKKLNVVWITKVLNSEKLENEILSTERLLLEQGQLPSIFFKVESDWNQIMAKKLQSFSLIPIEASSVLSKGGKIKKGSMVLVKGDGTESKYIKMIINERKKKNSLQIQSLYDNK